MEEEYSIEELNQFVNMLNVLHYLECTGQISNFTKIYILTLEGKEQLKQLKKCLKQVRRK